MYRSGVPTVFGLDPGPTQSALVVFDGVRILHHVKTTNEDLLMVLTLLRDDYADAVLVIEQIAAMGMAVGAEVFETCFWSGRFAERWCQSWTRLKRHEIKMHLCGNMWAKDANIRQALLDRFGVVGTKRHPGPLYGIAGDEWSALAVAVTWFDQQVDLHSAVNARS